jgi:bilirubin oxidase
MLGPTERVEILEDFATRRPRAEVALISQPFDSGARMEMMMGGGMGGMMGGNTNQSRSPGQMGMMESSQGREMLLARFTIGAEQPRPLAEFTLPKARSAPPEPRFELTTRIGFRHMRGFLNGREFEMKAVARDERVPRNVPLLWTFEHEDGMGMHMPHPMHVHGVRFRVVERHRGPHAPADVADGFVDQGYKDTVLVFPGERVRVAMTASEPGLFMYHCHNLEHEDGGMMRNFLVEA